MLEQELKLKNIQHKESRCFGREWVLFGRLNSGRYFVFIVDSYIYGTYYGEFLSHFSVLPYIKRWADLDPHQLNGKVKPMFRTMRSIVDFLTTCKSYRP